jgi:hypothetical protein
MSDLPKPVGKAHRLALRNHLAKNQIQKDNAVDPSAKKSKTKSTRTTRPDQGLKETDIISFNHGAEQGFVKLLQGIIREDGPLTVREAIREAAFELGVSVMTAQRYLEKHSARRAEFSISDGYVSLRSTK